jgi:hypothetical protein
MVSREFYSRDTIQREYRWLSRAGNVHSVAVPAMPVVIAEEIEVLDTPFSGSAAPLDICVVVRDLVVHIPDVVIRNIFGILGIDIASVIRITGDYVCVSDSMCVCGDIAGPVYPQQVGWDSRALLENPEALG